MDNHRLDGDDSQSRTGTGADTADHHCCVVPGETAKRCGMQRHPPADEQNDRARTVLVDEPTFDWNEPRLEQG